MSCRGTGRPCPVRRRRRPRAGQPRRRWPVDRSRPRSAAAGPAVGRVRSGSEPPWPRTGRPGSIRCRSSGVTVATVRRRHVANARWGVVSGVGPRGGGRMRAVTGECSLIAPHIDSIHQVAPASAYAAGEWSVHWPSTTMSAPGTGPASIAARRSATSPRSACRAPPSIVGSSTCGMTPSQRRARCIDFGRPSAPTHQIGTRGDCITLPIVGNSDDCTV